MNESRIYGKVKEKRLEFNSRYEYERTIARYDGLDIEIVIRPLAAKKTSAQDAYYRGVVCKILSDHTGYTRREIHDLLKTEMEIDTTTTLSRQEYSEYIAAVIRWSATTYDLYIPNASMSNQ